MSPRLSALLLLACSPAFAQDPWGAPAPAPAPSPAPVATPTPAAPTLPASAPVATAHDEVRETWNGSGKLVRRISLVDGELVSETMYAYDDKGRPSENKTIADGHLTLERWTYDDAGNVAVHAIVTDGVPVSSEAFTYEGGKLATQVDTGPDGTVTTRWKYDGEGRATLVEKYDAGGTLLSRSVSDREPTPNAPVPLTIGVRTGIATSSDVRTTSVSVGFEFARKPSAAQYSYSPLEVSAYGSYNRSTSLGELTNDQLKSGFGLDYNNLVGRMTAFLFSSVERNPVANLDVDVLVAPLGAKYDLIPDGVFTMDVSFAPVWNFRSIAVASGEDCDGLTLSEDGHCTYSKLRGSFRARVAVGNSKVKLKDTVEFLPTLNPDGGDLIAAVDEEGIFKNTASLDIKLTGALSLSESVVFVRDPLLTAQADCEADPDNMLCDGMSLQTGTTLALTYAF